MCKNLFIDLNEEVHHTDKIFLYPYYDYVKNIESRQSDEYNMVIIHAHGGCQNGQTYLQNYMCEKDNSGFHRYNIQELKEVLSVLKGKYILFLLACDSFSDSLSDLLNDNCIAIIAPTINICEDDKDNERIIDLKNKLLSQLNSNQISKVSDLISGFNEYIEHSDAFKFIIVETA